MKIMQKLKAKALHRMTISKLIYLEKEFVENRATRSDERFWKELLEELRWQSKFIKRGNESLSYFENVFKDYQEKFSNKN
ncbi:hypothetical protein [Bacillus thuringiensis]|uniref:Uncharacterized protein n=1 Tax=Bacillus thuringiensis TaxID=1428 RepID=A0A9X6VCU2_BACTU|nr:hypothetical protein [Bacillus thuringiensis]MEC3270642.1 hypothetical protein [Bacillus thuringiensis]PFB08130.1 hypothetical protein CN398_10465 [Bacillus thuringiensis]